jgi:hypothetical protein
MKTQWLILTPALIRAGATGGCGFTREQLDLLGVPRPLEAGWIDSLSGTVIDRAKYERFLALKGTRKRWRAKPGTGGGASLFD